MDAENQRRGIGIPLHKFATRLDSHASIPAGAGGLVRLGNLHRMVDHIASDDGLSA